MQGGNSKWQKGCIIARVLMRLIKRQSEKRSTMEPRKVSSVDNFLHINNHLSGDA